MKQKIKMMNGNFECPQCQQKKLQIIKSLDLGPDHRSDEVAIQCVECNNCGLKGMAIYEESRRGAGDSFHHFGYVISDMQFLALRSDIDNQQVSNKNAYHDEGQSWFNMVIG